MNTTESGFGPSELTVAELRQVIAMVEAMRRMTPSLPSAFAAEHERLIDIQLKLHRARLQELEARNP